MLYWYEPVVFSQVLLLSLQDWSSKGTIQRYIKPVLKEVTGEIALKVSYFYTNF